MKLHSVAAIAAVGICLSGCASIVRGSSQMVAIYTPPVTGATCTLTNPEGNWQLVTPGAVKVTRSKYDMVVNCKKEGWNDGAGTLPSNFQSWTVGNIVVGGLIGLGVDAATGSINDYPHSYPVPMTQAPPPAATAAPVQKPSTTAANS